MVSPVAYLSELGLAVFYHPWPSDLQLRIALHARHMK